MNMVSAVDPLRQRAHPNNNPIRKICREAEPVVLRMHAGPKGGYDSHPRHEYRHIGREAIVLNGACSCWLTRIRVSGAFTHIDPGVQNVQQIDFGRHRLAIAHDTVEIHASAFVAPGAAL
jgi:hypothetical protein